MKNKVLAHSAYPKQSGEDEGDTLVDIIQVEGESVKYISDKMRIEERHNGINDSRRHHSMNIYGGAATEP